MNSKATTIEEREFVFRNTSDELYKLLNEVLNYIQANLSEAEYQEVGSKCQLILVELFTNALKHSDADETIIKVVFDDELVIVNKDDRGRPFSIPRSQHGEEIRMPFREEDTNNRFIVYQDDMACLYCIPESPTRMSFVAIDHEINVPPIPSNLLEHFGLMIIAKAADKFTFTHDPIKGMNSFRAAIRYSNPVF